MKAAYQLKRAVCAVGTSALAIAAAAGTASAGGFDVREQSALFQGMSFAGAAAGGTALSSMFWNPAAAGYVGQGITMDSSYSLILPRADLTVEELSGALAASQSGLDRTVDVGRDAIVPASYIAYRLSSQLVLAMSMNSQFGLGTKPDNTDWAGQTVGRASKLFSINAAPTLAYEIAPGVQIGVGVQVQYLDLIRLRSAVPPAAFASGTLEGDDIGVGVTAGINITPMPGTSIGVGYRSAIEHELEGKFTIGGVPGSTPISADITTPEKVTLGIRQDLAPGLRAHATVEWTNWDRLGVVPIDGLTGTALEFNWEDGWYFALGGEYDYSNELTLRAGVGYEISPIQDAESRLVQLPDADRIWLSVGGSYKVGDLMGIVKDASIDFAYSHLFVEDADFVRSPANAGIPLTIAGDVDASVDIISVGLRSKF